VKLDYGRLLIWNLSELTGGAFPPYFLEIVMKDGRSHFVHSGNSRDEETQSVVVNIYDFRTMGEKDIAELLTTVEEIKVIPKKPSELHPQLSSGFLRCRLKDMLYVIQWERGRRWNFEQQFPEESRHKIGFSTPDIES